MGVSDCASTRPIAGLEWEAEAQAPWVVDSGPEPATLRAGMLPEPRFPGAAGRLLGVDCTTAAARWVLGLRETPGLGGGVDQGGMRRVGVTQSPGWAVGTILWDALAELPGVSLPPNASFYHLLARARVP